MAVSEYKAKRFQAFSWSFGNFGNALMGNILSVFVIIFYLDEVLVSPSNFDALLVTIVTFTGKFSEGLMNVPVARFSDNVRTRLGRRKPFFLLTPIWAMFFILVFACPFDEVYMVLIWLLITYCGFRWSNAAVVNPYLALLPEIAPEKHQRTDYNSYRTFFVLIGTILGILLFPIMRGLFSDPALEIASRESAFYATLPFAFVTLVGMAFVFFGVNENPKAVVTRFGMIESFKITFKNKSFFPSYLATVSTLMLAEAMLLAALPMIAQDYIGLAPDDIMVSLISGIFVISAIVSIPFIAFTSKRVGKAKTYYYCCLAFGILSWLLLVVGQLPGVTPTNTVEYVMVEGALRVVTTPAWSDFTLLQTILTIIIVGFPVGGVMVLGYSVFSDVIDYDEKLTGQRRESMYFAAQGVVDWFFAAFGDLMLGLLLTIFGREYFSSTVTTEAGLLNTGPLGILLVGPVAGTILILGALLFRRYPFMEGKGVEE
jgi:GPH family glycoside/pentoside/hexuronide:cation symporter